MSEQTTVGQTITVNRDTNAAAAALAAASKQPANQAMDPAREARRKTADRARSEFAAGQGQSPTPGTAAGDDAVPPVREDVEAIELQLTDGRRVWVGPPPGVSLKMRMMTGFGHMSLSPQSETRIHALMCVQSIDGVRVAPVVTMLDAQKLANDLGDNTVDILVEAYIQHWPPPRMADLVVIQKKMRGA